MVRHKTEAPFFGFVRQGTDDEFAFAAHNDHGAFGNGLVRLIGGREIQLYRACADEHLRPLARERGKCRHHAVKTGGGNGIGNGFKFSASVKICGQRHLTHTYGIIRNAREALAKEASDTIEKYSRVITPAIILIPGVSGNTGEGMSSVMKSVERAVGSALLD